MRITVFYNRLAGDREPSARVLARSLTNAGYEPSIEASDSAGWERVLRDPGAFVVAAGGDGTVATVARRLAGRSIPLAILPMGTANNIARALGLSKSLSDATEAWKTGRKSRLDIGVLRGADPDNDVLFLEGVGLGLVPEGIRKSKESKRAEARKSTPPVDGALRLFREALNEIRPRRLRIRVDGEPMEETLLLFEVLNTPSIGPDLPLAPRADPSDRMFDVVTVSESEREALQKYVEAPSARPLPPLRVRRAREIEIEGADGSDIVHADGKLHEVRFEAGGRRLSIGFHPDSVEVLGAVEPPR